MPKLSVAAFAILLLAQFAGGQDNAPAPQTGSGLPDVVIKTSAREVLLDVGVRDAHGKMVTNLKAEDFTVYEDGVRQPVRSFRMVNGSAALSEEQKQTAETPAAAGTVAPSAAQPALNPLRAVNVVCLILHDLDVGAGETGQNTQALAFESARHFVNNELRQNTFISIFSLDASGLRPLLPFSNNREQLLEAVRRASINQLPSINLSAAAMLNGLSISPLGSVTTGAGAAAEGNADGSGAGDPLGTRGDMGFSVYAGLREIDALRRLIRQLTPLPFQKTVLLLSNGLTRPPDQLEYWDSMIRSANKGNVTFYAVDIHGLCRDQFCSTTPSTNAAAMLQMTAAQSQQQATVVPWITPPGASPTARLAERAHEDDFVKFAVSSANPQEALRELTERTGGFLIANTNNVEKLMAHVMEEVNTHYEIAYPATSTIDDGHFRKIEVKLSRPGLTPLTRSGYFALPNTGAGPLTAEEMAGLRALDTQPRPHAFEFLARAYRFRDSGSNAQYAIAFEMPISNLTATAEERAHRHRFHASMLALVKNADGAIVDRVSKDVPSEVSDDQFERVRWEFMTYQRAVNLPPAHYTVETAVVDHEGNRASTGTFEIDNRQERGVGLSDLAVVRKLENLTTPTDPADPFEYTGKRVLPFVTSNLLAGMKPFVFFMIYPEAGNGAKPVLRVRLLKDGRAIATLKPDVAAPDASGGIPMLLKVTNKPGSYEVRATIGQGNSSTERTLQSTLADRK